MTITYSIKDDQSIREFRMAQACVNRKDFRLEIRGVYFEFSPAGNSMTATDGSRLVHVPGFTIEPHADQAPLDNVLIEFDAMVPKGATGLTISIYDDDSVVLTATTKRSQKLIPGRVLRDVTFPKYEKILAGNRLGSDREPTISSIGFNPLLVSELYEAFKPNGRIIPCEFRFGSDKDTIRVVIGGSDAHIVIMPMRV